VKVIFLLVNQIVKYNNQQNQNQNQKPKQDPKMTEEVRRAKKAGSWYEADAKVLSREMTAWSRVVSPTNVKAIIAPHAGYAYSGPTAGYAYGSISPENIKTVFILGPSHHKYIDSQCALTQMTTYETPLGDIPIDTEIVEELDRTHQFLKMSRKVDEQEHSIELHLPFLFHTMKNKPFKLVPILVGILGDQAADQYAKVLKKYFESPTTLFIFSSDFCHWGRRFDYYHIKDGIQPVWKSIEALDKEGMDAIEKKSPQLFSSYIKTNHNTICGKCPIMILLWLLERSDLKFKVSFNHYAQSNQCTSKNDSSVSYASGLCVPE